MFTTTLVPVPIAKAVPTPYSISHRMAEPFSVQLRSAPLAVTLLNPGAVGVSQVATVVIIGDLDDQRLVSFAPQISLTKKVYCVLGCNGVIVPNTYGFVLTIILVPVPKAKVFPWAYSICQSAVPGLAVQAILAVVVVVEITVGPEAGGQVGGTYSKAPTSGVDGFLGIPSMSSVTDMSGVPMLSIIALVGTGIPPELTRPGS